MDFETSVVKYLENLTISADTMQGLNALIHWIDGFQAADKGKVPGSFSLLMLYRTLNGKNIKISSIPGMSSDIEEDNTEDGNILLKTVTLNT